MFSKEKFRYNTIQDVINDTGLTIGLVVETDGYNALGDGFDAKYLITNINEQGNVLLKNGNYAKEISNSNGSNKLDKGNVSSEYDTAKKIEDKIKAVQDIADNKLNKGNLPATITDAKEIYDLLENNGGINIDTALLYLNDTGTKTQGKVYFDKNKKGLFECIKTTTSTVNSTEFFVDISNKASSDRLSNLTEIERYSLSNNASSQPTKFNKIKEYWFSPKELNNKSGVVLKEHDLSKDFSSIAFSTISSVGYSTAKTIGARINEYYKTRVSIISWNETPNQSVTYGFIVYGIGR